MRFLYIKVLHILNQMVYLMLRIMGHVHVSHLTGVFTQFWGTMQLMPPPMQTLGGRVPLSPASPCIYRHFLKIENKIFVTCLLLTLNLQHGIEYEANKINGKWLLILYM